MRRVRYDFSLTHRNPCRMVRYPAPITHPTYFKRKRRLRLRCARKDVQNWNVPESI